MAVDIGNEDLKIFARVINEWVGSIEDTPAVEGLCYSAI